VNISDTAKLIESYFAGYKVQVDVIPFEILENGERHVFEIKQKMGTKEKAIFDAAGDVQTAIGIFPLFFLYKVGLSIRLVVSERKNVKNSLWKMLTSREAKRLKMCIPIALGYNMRGEMYFADLVYFPHGIIGGGSGSGKTFGIRAMVVSIIVSQKVSQVNLIIADVKTGKLELFQGLPHLVRPVIRDEETLIKVTQLLAIEVKRRHTLSEEEVRQLPAIIFINDEYSTAVQEMEKSKRNIFTSALSTILRLGRQVKCIVLVGVQETGKSEMFLNLNNFQTKIAYRSSDGYTSKSMLGKWGAENLPIGSMFFKSPKQPETIYLSGAMMEAPEIKNLVARIIAAPHDLGNKFTITDEDLEQLSTQPPENSESQMSTIDPQKELSSIIMWCLSRENFTKTQIKEKFKMGNRVNKLVDELFQLGLVSGDDGNKGRTVLVQNIEGLSLEATNLLKLYYSEVDIVDAFDSRVDDD
jgi:S-DNA-T family DNA segregation ATPase FtsK/SpoIIIE